MDTKKKITAAIFSFNTDITNRIISNLNEIGLFDKIVVVSKNEIEVNRQFLIKSDHPFNSEAIKKVIEKTSTPHLLLINVNKYVELTSGEANTFISEADKTNAGWIYSDFYEKQTNKLVLHPLIDYQIGSVRDDFDFGNCCIVKTNVAKDCLEELYSAKSDLRYSGLYDLRLAISRHSSVVRICDPLYSPQSLIAEGTAVIGEELLFPGDERMKFEKEILFPLAKLDTTNADLYYKVISLQDKLSGAGILAARSYLNGDWTEAEAVAWLQKFQLRTKERAEKFLSFITTYRSYIVTYSMGEEIIRNYVESNSGADDNLAMKWEILKKLISTPQTPSGLLD